MKIKPHADSVEPDLEKTRKGLAIALLLILTPILIVGHFLGVAHQAYWLFCSLAALIFAGFVNWEHRLSWRFWMPMMGLLMAHVLAIFFIPYPHVRFTAVFIPAFILDFVITAYIIHWIAGTDPKRDA